MGLDRSVFHNFLNCVDIKFPTEIILKFLEQIEYLNFYEF
jgi:hypothetical protein